MIRQHRVIASECRRVPLRKDELERNLVVHVAAPAAAARAGAGGCRDFARGPGRTEITTRVVSAEIAAAPLVRFPLTVVLVLLFTAIGTIGLGLFPNPVLNFILQPTLIGGLR